MKPPRLSTLLFLLSILFYWFPPSIQFLARRRFLKQARFFIDVLHQLSTTPLQVYNVTNSMDCLFKCIEHDQCLSFNIAVNSTGGLKRCQLLSTDKYNSSTNFTSSTEFNYHHIDVGLKQRVLNPCRNGGSLILFYWTANCRCACLAFTYGKYCEGFKLNTNPVRVEGKNNKFGTFTAPKSGRILKFELVHVSGGLTCWPSRYEITKFGCGDLISMYITNQANEIVSPSPRAQYINWRMAYSLEGVTSNDSEIILPEIDPPLQVTAGQEFRLWYGEDLSGKGEHDNTGVLNVDVHAFYA